MRVRATKVRRPIRPHFDPIPSGRRARFATKIPGVSATIFEGSDLLAAHASFSATDEALVSYRRLTAIVCRFAAVVAQASEAHSETWAISVDVLNDAVRISAAEGGAETVRATDLLLELASEFCDPVVGPKARRAKRSR